MKIKHSKRAYKSWHHTRLQNLSHFWDWKVILIYVSGSCSGLCGGASADCYCDDNCSQQGDCCHDYESECHVSKVNTCQGRCGHVSVSVSGCQCDNQCVKVGDCCQDYSAKCLPSLIATTQKPLKHSCKNKCLGKKSLRFLRKIPDTTCYCDEACVKVGDCCEDYDQYCQDTKTTTTTQVSVTFGTCEGRCYNAKIFRLTSRKGNCECDIFCQKYGDCCPDYLEKCVTTTTTTSPSTTTSGGGSCLGHCGGATGDGCYCDSGCDRAGDCCQDYKQVCQDKISPTGVNITNTSGGAGGGIISNLMNIICGIRGPLVKVVGGENTKKNDYTWMALLTHDPTFSSSHQRKQISYSQVSQLMRTHKPFCGGTLVSSYWVVSASHCTTGATVPGKYVIVFGEWDRETEDDSFVAIHHVIQRLQHPQYNPTNQDNDIALWRLQEPVDLNHFRPICLPYPGWLLS